MKYVLSYSARETCRRKGYYIVCLFACFLVALVALVSKTIITQASLIFLMISEQELGQIDVELTTSPKEKYYKQSLDDLMIDNSFLNFTAIKEIVNEEIISTSTIRSNYRGVDYNRTVPIELFVINSTQEKTIGLGREFPDIEMKRGECIIHRYLNNKMTTDNDSMIEMYVHMPTILINTMIPLIDRSNQTKVFRLYRFLNHYQFYIPLKCKVIQVISSNYGKVKEMIKNTVFMEMEYFYEYLSTFISDKLRKSVPKLLETIKNINPNDYGNILISNFPPNRISSYLEGDYEMLLEKGVKYGNALIQAMNSLKETDIQLPIIDRMKIFNFGIVFINMILNMIVISLFMLSLVLIYSLLSITIETNTFEFAVLRLIGNTKKQILAIILLQCFSFSIPAYVLAYLAHLQVIKLFNVIMKQFVKSEMSIGNTYQSFIYSLLINFLAPLLSSAIPIMNILKKDIASNLNSSINNTKGMKIEIISVEKKDNETLVVFGLITFFYGACIYYFLPLSMISLNLTLLGSIFLIILLGILLGLGIISLNLENILQKMFTYVFCVCYKKYMKQMIIKNLSAHRIKNRKSSLMITMSVSILIMVSVTLDIVIHAVEDGKVQKSGDKFVIQSNFLTPFNYLKIEMQELIDKRLIKTFALKSKRLNELCTNIQATIENIGNSFSSRCNLITVSPNYFEITDNAFLMVLEKNKGVKDSDLTHQLYTRSGIDKIGVSGFYKWKYGTDINNSLKLTFTQNDTFYSLVVKPAFLLKAAPGLRVTNEPILAHFPRDVIVSIPTFFDLLNKCKRNLEEINNSPSNSMHFAHFPYDYFPFDSIYLETIVPSNTTLKAVQKEIKAIITKKRMMKIWSYEDSIEDINNISELIFKIFNYITCVILFFCFFNLAASMSINIFEQKKEIAIIRSIGMTSYQVIFIYIGEATVLILSSSFLGIAIGSLVSYTMSIQFQLFTHVIVAFQVRVANLIIVMVFAMLGGILSTIIPGKKMLGQPIAQLVKET